MYMYMYTSVNFKSIHFTLVHAYIFTNIFYVAIYVCVFFTYIYPYFSLLLSLSLSLCIQILSFDSPYILPPDKQPHTVLVLKFTIQSSDCFFNTTLRFATNMSFFNIPLQCYDGRLHVSTCIFIYCTCMLKYM